jgi:hypothetical protein
MQLQSKKIFLFGHSSGGGLAIRFAGGDHGIPVYGYVLLSPAISRAPTMRQGTAGGLASVHLLKLLFCSFLAVDPGIEENLGFGGLKPSLRDYEILPLLYANHAEKLLGERNLYLIWF